ncbi:hypothetical protein BAE44_0009477 [Dichanthelium oligosanthes]|uniref:Inhibitor I9 domain-containing protein n=1 Tax=Dichanthelium oligosanthes TaxID=888268 RepID=A0A1E5VWL6_9POAL|nr:hypothetical protein BAE44_0009477 [Dichanthelium oligosanthes]
MTTTSPHAFLLLALLVSAAVALAAGREGKHGHGQQQQASSSVYMVMVKPPAQGVDCEAYQMHILATALGSEARAKEALVYSYKTVVSGFAAKLTPAQLAALQSEFPRSLMTPFNFAWFLVQIHGVASPCRRRC